jgi:hypothetical protein
MAVSATSKLHFGSFDKLLRCSCCGLEVRVLLPRQTCVDGKQITTAGETVTIAAVAVLERDIRMTLDMDSARADTHNRKVYWRKDAVTIRPVETRQPHTCVCLLPNLQLSSLHIDLLCQFQSLRYGLYTCFASSSFARRLSCRRACSRSCAAPRPAATSL